MQKMKSTFRKGTVAIVVDLKVVTIVDLCTWAMDFRPKVQSVKTTCS
jgi:hypothetical protein